MAAPSIEPHAEQIISLKGKEIELNPDALRQILLQDNILDKQVCVVSVTGVFRQGKSFLLNFFIRYLQNKYKLKKITESRWLDSADGPITGFPFKGGSMRHTLGILMWSEVFLAQLPSGNEIAIILMDTQGTFDNLTTVTHCAAIFALSTLISSVQIYNLKETIKQYDLAHLECFSGYGKLIGNSEGRPFQNLVFLIRDWPWPDEKEFGAKGGQQLLNEIFNNSEGHPEELVTQRKNINELFEKISCFLLPYPGTKVATSRYGFKGDLEDVDRTFKRHIEDFVPSILAPENIALKTVNGEAITARDLFCFIETYCSCFKNGEMPSLQSMFTASADAHHTSALNEAECVYERSMDFIISKNSTSLNAHILHNTHYQSKSKALQHFQKKKIIGNKETRRNFELKLEKMIEEKFAEYRNFNNIKLEKEEEVARQIKLRKEQERQDEQRRQEQQRSYERKLEEEERRRRQQEQSVEQLKREQSYLQDKQRMTEEQLRSEKSLRHQQELRYEEKLREEQRRKQEEITYRETIKTEQKLRRKQEEEYKERIKKEEQLRRDQELQFKEQLKREREMILEASSEERLAKRTRRLSE